MLISDCFRRGAGERVERCSLHTAQAMAAYVHVYFIINVLLLISNALLSRLLKWAIQGVCSR